MKSKTRHEFFLKDYRHTWIRSKNNRVYLHRYEKGRAYPAGNWKKKRSNEDNQKIAKERAEKYLPKKIFRSVLVTQYPSMKMPIEVRTWVHTKRPIDDIGVLVEKQREAIDLEFSSGPKPPLEVNRQELNREIDDDEITPSDADDGEFFNVIFLDRKGVLGDMSKYQYYSRGKELMQKCGRFGLVNI